MGTIKDCSIGGAAVAWTLQIIGPLASMTVTILLFFGFLFGSYRFFRWLWGRLPNSVVSVPPDQIHKTLGLLISLIFFPSLILFAWGAAQSLVNYVPEVIQAISGFGMPSSCQESVESEQARCVSDFAANLAKLVGFVSSRLVTALSLTRFPAADFVWFLLTAVITTQVIGAIHHAAQIAGLGSWYASMRQVLPEIFWQRVAFTLLVLVSFYLGLCALLAIPLFQEKSQSQQLTVEALGKALEANIIKPELFDQRFPKDPPPLREPTLSKAPEAFAEGAGTIFNMTIQTQTLMWQDQQAAWSTLRATAATGPADWRDQAVNAFMAGLEVSAGRRQTAQHFNDLFLWHQRLSQLTREALSRCQSALTSFVFTAFQTSDGLRIAIEATTSAASSGLASETVRQLQQGFYPAYENTRRVCQLDDAERPPIPQRPSFSSVLGPVGSWSRWLLDTGQMPVVIIVGLVGFSLLGATVSRAVRAKDENLKAGLTLDDLLSVVAGGMTAAVVVFLAAYGGLAVLGNSAGDPNPYVVFVTCLIGAVYSEDVWSWARKRLLTTQTGGKDRTAQDAPADDQTQTNTAPESPDETRDIQPAAPPTRS
jgi:hypothetical protein